LTPGARTLTLPGTMRSSTKISTKGQVVIPKAMRDRLRWTPGTRLQVRLLMEGGLALEAVGPSKGDATAEDPIDRAFGVFRECREDILGALEADHRAELADESS
jgi:AbrB family looped-hinge helix DNA binding protein